MTRKISREEMEGITGWVSCEEALPPDISWEDDTFFNVSVNVTYDFHEEDDEPSVVVMSARYDSEENMWFSKVDVNGMDDDGVYDLYFHYVHTMLDCATKAVVTHWMPTPKPPCKKDKK